MPVLRKKKNIRTKLLHQGLAYLCRLPGNLLRALQLATLRLRSRLRRHPAPPSQGVSPPPNPPSPPQTPLAREDTWISASNPPPPLPEPPQAPVAELPQDLHQRVIAADAAGIADVEIARNQGIAVSSVRTILRIAKGDKGRVPFERTV